MREIEAELSKNRTKAEIIGFNPHVVKQSKYAERWARYICVVLTALSFTSGQQTPD
jgi:hypothetical protein